MNKQVGYITSAHLILLCIATGYFFISKISSAAPGNSFDINSSQQSTNTTTTIPAAMVNGKNLFFSKCASCHNPLRDATGPALQGFEERGPWADRKQLYKWIRNPELFMKNDPYTKGLKDKFGSMMTSFPAITDQDIDAIMNYISFGYQSPKAVP